VLTATIQDAVGNTITSGPDSTLSIAFGQSAGTGSVTGSGSVTAVAGVASLTLTGAAVGNVTIHATSGALADGTGNPLSFNVVAGGAAKIPLSASPAPLATVGTRVLTATIQDAAGNTITSGPGSTLSVSFGQSAGTGSVTGTGSVAAVAGVASLTVT